MKSAVRPKLVMAFVVEALDGRLFDGAIHSLDLPISPGMVRLGKPVFDVVGLADHVEAHLARPGGVAVARLLGQLDAPFNKLRTGLSVRIVWMR